MKSKEFLDIVFNRDNNKTRKLIELSKNKEFEVCIWGAGKIGKTLGKEILDYLGVHINYYCDKNTKLLHTVITDNIICENEKRLFDNKKNTVCFVMLGYADIESACDYLISNGVKNIITYDDLCELPEIIEYFLPIIKKNKVVIYTCITGDYDDVREPEYISSNCDYVLISEAPPKKGSIYKWIELSKIIPEEIKDPIYQNRFCKMHPHLIFPNYRFSIYVDGNITITSEIEKFVDDLKSARIGVPGNNFSNNYYNHALRAVKMGGDNVETFLEQITDYHNQGMPMDIGSYLCNILIREHNHPICVKMMEEWWSEYLKYSKRDQMSFPYVLWKNNFSKRDLFLLCIDNEEGVYYKNSYWKYDRQHKKERFVISEDYCDGVLEM